MNERAYFESVRDDMPDETAAEALNRICEFFSRKYGRGTIVLLDEYDTPMREAWLCGYWDQVTSFIRSLFNATFKTNPFLERALITGITCVAEESVFSDMNNPEVVTVTSRKYGDCFGFTEEEVYAAMDEFGLANRDEVKFWYDGFTFGEATEIYNPWSITKYLDSGGEFDKYWVNTSGNGLVSRLVREGDADIKRDFEELLGGGTVRMEIDERVTFKMLGRRSSDVWALPLASGYLKVVSSEWAARERTWIRELKITNYETMRMFEGLVLDWFGADRRKRSPFVAALLAGDLPAMNAYMSDLVETTISSFDSGAAPSRRTQPERFWHGLVLGLLVELRATHRVRSNPESAFGRCDVLIEPLDPLSRDPQVGDGIVIEFKARDAASEKTLAKTVEAAKAQIVQRGYATELVARGIPEERIRTYGFAFAGKRVRIG